MFLTPEELEALTDKQRSDAQIRWLIRNGYKFELSGAGRPKVLRSVLLGRLDASEPSEPILHL